MPDFRKLLPSVHIAAGDLDDRDVVVKITKIVKAEEVGRSKEPRPVIYFEGIPKGLVMNKVNGTRISKLYGNDTDNWIGKCITLYPTECEMGGETVPCVRVRTTMPETAPTTASIAAPDAVNPMAALEGMTKEQILAFLASKP